MIAAGGTVGLADWIIDNTHVLLTDISGDIEDRVLCSLNHIGPPVLNGGLTTMIAVFLLQFAQAYAYRVGFMILYLAIGFGLYHALILLPTLLITYGPYYLHTCSSKYHN